MQTKHVLRILYQLAKELKEHHNEDYKTALVAAATMIEEMEKQKAMALSVFTSDNGGKILRALGRGLARLPDKEKTD